jgi:NAD(P)-dependent dehydrogenase (short-subunit alcohol dehydrogenase family)
VSDGGGPERGGRSALVTGGSSGIGLGVSRALLEDGYGVTVVARQEAKLMAAAGGLEEFGDVHPVVADFRSEDAIEAAVDAHERRFGGMDVLVNNAGIAVGGTFESTSTKEVDLALGVNLRAAILCTRAAISMLLSAAPSQIINVSSLTGLDPKPGLTAYSSSKAGLIAFTDVLRAEFASRGVKATALCPGFVDTAMSDVVRPFVDAAELIQVSDVVEIVRALLRLSPACVVPTVALEGPDRLEPWTRASADRAAHRAAGNGGEVTA